MRTSAVAPMHLLEPRRRVRAMRAVFRAHARHIAAVMAVAVRPAAGGEAA